MHISLIILFILINVTKHSYSQDSFRPQQEWLSSSLDSADAAFIDYMGFRRANPIYEMRIPAIIAFIENSEFPKSARIEILNRWYKSQANYAKGLQYQYGDRVDFSPIRSILSRRGIRCVPEIEDGPQRIQPFVPDTDFFLKYSFSLDDTLLTHFLNLVKDEESWRSDVFLVIKCEDFLNSFSASFYSPAVWKKYAAHTQMFLSNFALYRFDLGPDDHCTKITRAIEDNKLYLTTYPKGLIAPMVKRNLGKLLSITQRFCKETDSLKRMRIIMNLAY